MLRIVVLFSFSLREKKSKEIVENKKKKIYIYVYVYMIFRYVYIVIQCFIYIPFFSSTFSSHFNSYNLTTDIFFRVNFKLDCCIIIRYIYTI